MSKNANYIYPPFVMSNDINLGEGWEGGSLIKKITLKAQIRNSLNCYMNSEEIHSYRDIEINICILLLKY